MWLSMVADPELQFSVDPRKSVFAGEIPGRLFVSGYAMANLRNRREAKNK